MHLSPKPEASGALGDEGPAREDEPSLLVVSKVGEEGEMGADVILDIPKLTGIDDTTLFAWDQATEDRFSDAVAEQRQQGMYISAPRLVDLEKNGQIPIGWFQSCSDHRTWEVHRPSNSLVLIAENQGRFSTTIDLYERPIKQLDVRARTKSRSGLEPTGTIKGQYIIVNLYDILESHPGLLPAGAYVFTGLSYNWRSNTELVSIRNGKRQDHAGFREPRYARKGVERLVLSSDLQLSGVAEQSISEPGGIDIRLPELPRASSPFELSLTVRLPRDFFTPDLHREISVFFLKLDERDPAKLSIKLPAIYAASIPATRQVELRAQLRLTSPSEELRLKAGEYMVVAAMGPAVGGPVKLLLQP